MFYDLAREWQWNFQDPASPLMEGLIDLHHNILFLLILIFGLVVTLISSLLYNQIVKNESLTNYLYISFIHLKYSPTIVLGASFFCALLISWNLLFFLFFFVSFILILTPWFILSLVSSFSYFYMVYPLRARIAIHLSLYLFLINTFSDFWISEASCHWLCNNWLCVSSGFEDFTFYGSDSDYRGFVTQPDITASTYRGLMGVLDKPDIHYTSGATIPVKNAMNTFPSANTTTIPAVASKTTYESAYVLAEKSKASVASNLKVPNPSPVPSPSDQVKIINMLIKETVHCKDMTELAKASTNFVSRIYPEDLWPKTKAEFLNEEHPIHQVVNLFAHVPNEKLLTTYSNVIRAALLTAADCNIKGASWSTHPQKVYVLFMRYYDDLTS